MSGSCTLLRRSQSINKQYHIKQELQSIRAELSKASPSLQTPKILYLYDEKGVYQEPLTALLKLLPTDDPISVEVALMMGDGEELLKRATDTLQMLNAHLLMGNSCEADRLLGLCQEPDKATLAMARLNSEDTVGCVALLEQLMREEERVVATRSARLWHLLEPKAKAPLEYLKSKSPSQWERFTAAAKLGEGRAETAEEQAYIATQKAIEKGDSIWLREAVQLLMTVGESEWHTEALVVLRPMLYRQQMWVEALMVQERLPQAHQSDYPYSLLKAYSQEIDLLQRYQMPAEQIATNTINTINTISSPTGDLSFRSKWGNVQNIDDWVMVETMGFQSERLTSSRPTEETYKRVLNHLNQVLPNLEGRE